MRNGPKRTLSCRGMLTERLAVLARRLAESVGERGRLGGFNGALSGGQEVRV